MYFSNILQKISSQKFFHEKMKMTTQKTIVLESFVIIGLSDYDHTHKADIDLWPIGIVPQELYFLPKIHCGIL